MIKRGYKRFKLGRYVYLPNKLNTKISTHATTINSKFMGQSSRKQFLSLNETYRGWSNSSKCTI